MKPWPKLSETLTGPKDPQHCQSCGGFGHVPYGTHNKPGDLVLIRWREHDEKDQPTVIVVVLCKDCSNRLIEPHPRIYDALHSNEPVPGSLEMCMACPHRAGVSCTHSLLIANGGPGLQIIVPKPIDMIACSRGRGKGHGCRHLTIYPRQPSMCEGLNNLPSIGETPHGN